MIPSVSGVNPRVLAFNSATFKEGGIMKGSWQQSLRSLAAWALVGAFGASGSSALMASIPAGAANPAPSGEMSWGYGLDGEVGNGTTTLAQTTPVNVSLPAGVTAQAIAAGLTNGYAIGSNGNLYAWGTGALGELGNGSTTNPETTPVTVSLPNGVTPKAIAAGAATGYAIGSDGNLYAWGYGPAGELGNGTTTLIQSTPVTVWLPAGVTAKAITAGADSAYAIGSNGNLYAWGSGTEGELGNGTTTSIQSTPVTVSLPTGVTPKSIAAARGGTGYAIGSDGNEYAWGVGLVGQLGNGTVPANQLTPVPVSLPTGVTPKTIAAGAGTGYAIGSDGNLYAWGYGYDGELGNGTTTFIQTTPVTVSLPTGVTAIAAGAYTGYAIGSDGNLYAWGSGLRGELGNGTTTFIQSTPVTVSLPAGVVTVAIAGGSNTAYALVSVGAAALLATLRQSVIGVGPGTSLYDKLGRAQTYLAANDRTDTCSTLSAFINEVKAQTGKSISNPTAASLIASATRIRAVLGC